MANSKIIQQLRNSMGLFITGGDWSLALPIQSRQNLVKFWYDGVFSAASDTIPINYLTLYLLALGATSTQVGMFTALTSLAAAACLLPGALLVERYGRRKEITVLFGGIIARLMLLLLALLPFIFKGELLIWAVILFSVIRSAGGNLAFPAWMSITGDIVPMQGRGRYFGSRTLVMVAASILTTYLVGEFITLVGSPQGYQLSMGLAFAVGLASTFFFARIQLPDQRISSPVAKAEDGSMSISLPIMWKELRATPLFLTFCFASALWNFFINVSGPFFNVYMVQNLQFTAAMVGIAAVSASVSKIFIQKKVGELSDRWGPGKVQMIVMFLIPILPIMWVFVTQLWQVVLLNVFGGFLWGSFELVSFNFLLQLTPDDQRARYSAIFQVIVTLALAGGAALGSSIILWWGYQGVFLISAFGRILAAVMFLNLIRQMNKKKAEPELDSAESAI